MSANVKKAGRIGTKIIAALLFVFLVMFNVQIGMDGMETVDNNLLGLSLSIFVPSVIASEGKWAEVCCGPSCPFDFCVGNGTYICCK